MNVYIDTSALVPVLIDEPTSDSFRELWRGADRLTSTRLLFVESASALERARQTRRISDAESMNALGRLEELWCDVFVFELDEQLMREASVLASRFGLRGFDSVHCAAAFQMNGEGVVAASSDKRLNDAWSNLGLATFEPGR